MSVKERLLKEGAKITATRTLVWPIPDTEPVPFAVSVGSWLSCYRRSICDTDPADYAAVHCKGWYGIPPFAWDSMGECTCDGCREAMR